MGFFDTAKRRIGLGPGVTLYYPGCYTGARAKPLIAATKEVLRDLGEECIMLDIPCCGCTAWLNGYEDEFERVKARVTALLREHQVTRIITNEPECAITFKERYGLETKHIVQVLDDHIEKLHPHETRQANYIHPSLLIRLGVEPRIPLRVLRRAGIHVPAENDPSGCAPADYVHAMTELTGALARAKRFTAPLVATACPRCRAAFGTKAKDIIELVGER